MNKYLAFYNHGKRVDYHRSNALEVEANTALEAQTIAAKAYGLLPKNAWKVAVMLAEKNGQPVVHTPDF